MRLPANPLTFQNLDCLGLIFNPDVRAAALLCISVDGERR
jgi:hypothetical protein